MYIYIYICMWCTKKWFIIWGAQLLGSKTARQCWMFIPQVLDHRFCPVPTNKNPTVHNRNDRDIWRISSEKTTMHLMILSTLYVPLNYWTVLLSFATSFATGNNNLRIAVSGTPCHTPQWINQDLCHPWPQDLNNPYLAQLSPPLKGPTMWCHPSGTLVYCMTF